MNIFTEYVAVDIGTHSLKFFSVSGGDSGGAYIISDCREEALPPGLICGGFTNPTISQIAKFTEIFQKTMSRISSPKAGLIVGLPDRWVKLHLLEMKLKPEEVASSEYISWRLKKTLPLPSPDTIIDHQILSQTEIDNVLQCNILAGLLRKEIVDLLSEIFLNLKIEVMAFDTSTLGVYNLLEDLHPESTLDRNVIMCHVGHEATVVKIFQNGILRYERVIEVGGEEFSRLLGESENLPFDQAHTLKTKRSFFPITAEDILTKFQQNQAIKKIFGNWLRELNVTFRFYQDKFKVMHLPRIYLTGGSCLFDGIAEFIADYFETPCERFNPLAEIPTTHKCSPDILAQGPQFAPCMGLLSR